MNRTVPLVALLSLFLVNQPDGVFSMGERPPSPPTPEPAPAERKATIVFDESVFDFGEVSGEPKIEHVFTFRNDGNDVLKISKVKTTCGCTAALLSSKELPPGGTGEIKTTFTVGARQGKQVKRIHVQSNDPDNPQLRLEIKGTIIPAVAVAPRSLHFYDAKNSPSKTVKISQTLDRELILEKPATRLGLVTAVLREKAPADGKKRYLLDVGVKPDLQPGRYFEHVTLKTNNPDKPQIQIPVRITIRGDIEVAPRRLNLGALKPGQEISRNLTVSNRKGEAFVITKAEVDNKVFTVDLKTPTSSRASHNVTIMGTAGGKPGAVKTKIVFHTDYEPQKTAEAHVYGFIRGAKRPVPAAPAKPAPSD